jgi:hypothetical protein
MFESAGLLDGLNEEQRRAAAHPGGPLLILAGAGTGKTRTLVARAAWLCEQGMPPSRILLLTFTRRAADDMLSRATARARTANGRITGGTFHAIAHRIIRQHAEAFSLPPEFTVIDPADMADLLDARRADHGLAGTQRRAPRASVCADIYTRCVNTQMTVADVVRRGFPWCEDYTGQLAELFRGYVAHKRSHALVDFDDLLLLWRAALADPAAGPVLRGMFDAVLVDEYQDVNAVQADIVRLLQPEAGCLTCVGDDAQAIYAFRGADPEHLHRLADAFPGLTVVRLARTTGRGGGAAAGQRGPPAVGRAGARAHRGPRGRGGAGAGALPRRGDAGPRDLRPGPRRPRGRHGTARPGGAGARGASQRRAGDRAGGPRHPVRQVRRAAVHRGGSRQGLPGGGQDRRQPRRRRRLVPGAPAA